MLGETIAHYRLTDRLGAGAMGEVFLAEDTRLHRPVALKMLSAEAGDDEAAAARLVREARVASALTHPNIAVIYEIGEIEREGRRRGFIAMEYVPGRTLAEIASERRLEVGEILGIARQIAEALAEAHHRGVVHRDVKPGNVMMTDRGLVKVLDFGLAKYAPAGTETATWSGAHRLVERPGAVMGTLAYMSPEQARGGVVDERSDVFSLGVLIYELLEGTRPFTGSNTVELLEAILREPPPPLVRHEGPLAKELGQVVVRMIEKEPERRHRDMDAVRRDLESLLSGRAPAASTAESETPSIAVMSFTNITRSDEDDWLGTGIAETVSSGLATVPDLAVVSRARVSEVLRKLGGASGDEETLAPRLGRELGARLVVSGGYQRLSDQVRVTARVTDLSTGTVVQTLKVDGSMAGIFDLQDRILGELSAGLRLHLPASAATASRDLYETRSIEAYEAFAKGLINLRAESPDALDRAILHFERSVALDPDYAAAHVQRGMAYELKADYLSMPELYDRALASVDRALVLRPGFVQAHRTRASVLLDLGREDEALEAIERALALDPGAAYAHQTLGRIHFIGFGDFARAAEHYEKALTLNPHAGWSALQLAHAAALAGDATRAEAAAWRAVVLQEEFLSGREGQLIVGAYVRLGQALALQGRYEEALHQFGREVEFLQRVDHALRSRIFIELHQRIGDARIRFGDAAGGRAALNLAIEAFERRLRTGADDPFTRYYAACAYALRGETDKALCSLEKAARSRRRLTGARARVEPALESLRALPRFEALVATS